MSHRPSLTSEQNSVREALKRGHRRSLSAQQLCVLEALKRGPVTIQDLIEELYSDHPDGGPLWGEAGIRVQIHRIRRAGIPVRHIRPCGYVVAMESP